MSEREELTAESEALLSSWDLGDDPVTSEWLRPRLAAIEAAAVTRHVRETGCEGHRAIIASARFVATYWRDEWMEQLALGQRHAPLVTHPLAMVLGALDGEMDPVYLGIASDRHADYRAAIAAREEAPK